MKLGIKGVSAAVLIAAALVGAIAWRGRHTPRAGHDVSPVAPDVGMSDAPVLPEGWTPVAGDSPLLRARSVAFTPEGVLMTDGQTAYWEHGGERDPIEIEVPLTRVFAVEGRFYATGEHRGAPILVVLTPEAPRVVTLPCHPSRLAGKGDSLAVVCEEGGLAMSQDGARRFVRWPLRWTPPPDAPKAVMSSIDAVAVGGDGRLSVAGGLRWAAPGADGKPLLWSFNQLASGKGFPLRMTPLPELYEVVGLVPEGDGLRVAGIDRGGEGTSPRLFSVSPSSGVVPIGAPGPACPPDPETGRFQGVLLTSRIAAFLCDGSLRITENGTDWSEVRFPEPVTALFGGAMQLMVQTRGGAAYVRRSDRRTDFGAVALPIDPALAERVKEASKPPPIPQGLPNAPSIPTDTVIQEPPPRGR